MSEIQEVLKKRFSRIGKHRFGVELDSMDRVIAVDHAHHRSIFGPGIDPEAIWERFPFDDQRVVTCGGERIREPLEDSGTIVMHLGSFAMHDGFSPHHSSAKSLADCLVAQTDPQDRDALSTFADEVHRDSRLVGSAGTRRYDDSRGSARDDLIGGDLVVSHDLQLGSEFAQVLDQVVSKGIVIIKN